MSFQRGRVVYLHGFASSPLSRKATVLGGHLRELGFQVEIPALDENDFEHLTISKQLRHIESVVAGGPVVLIGSSLGGYLAALYAAQYPTQVTRLILLAPAFDFARLWHTELGPERLAEWQRTGTLPVFHYGAGSERALAYDLMQDAEQYAPFPNVPQPALIFHGEQDPLVPIDLSRCFVADHPRTRLIPLSSGHELTDVLSCIWQHSKDFLMHAEPEIRC